MKKWNIDKDWLENKYLNEKLSTRQIAKLIGCLGKTIDLRLKEYGIPTRTREEALGLYRTGKYVECSNGCGQAMYRKLYNLNKYSVFFCSWKCEKEYQSKTRRKSNFFFGWRRYKEYKNWRKNILKRDRKCVLCSSEVKLAVHHILEAQTFPELVYKINNGVTLCQSCHIRVHQQDSTKFIKSLQEVISVENSNIGENLEIDNSEGLLTSKPVTTTKSILI
jgi:5-methylcytosine-specific restriction endonuclease McrA